MKKKLTMDEQLVLAYNQAIGIAQRRLEKLLTEAYAERFDLSEEKYLLGEIADNASKIEEVIEGNA